MNEMKYLQRFGDELWHLKCSDMFAIWQVRERKLLTDNYSFHVKNEITALDGKYFTFSDNEETICTMQCWEWEIQNK